MPYSWQETDGLIMQRRLEMEYKHTGRPPTLASTESGLV